MEVLETLNKMVQHYLMVIFYPIAAKDIVMVAIDMDNDKSLVWN